MSLSLHHFTIPAPGIKRKVIYQFSDCHLSWADADSTPEEVAAVTKATVGMDGCRQWYAKEKNEPYDTALTAVDYFDKLLEQCADGDAVLCAGDLAECFNHATLQRLDDKTAPFTFLSVCGNHDQASFFPDGYAISAVKQPVQRLDLGDLLVLGFDDSLRVITPQQLAALEAALAEDKPLLLLMHIPFGVEGNIHMLRGCLQRFHIRKIGVGRIIDAVIPGLMPQPQHTAHSGIHHAAGGCMVCLTVVEQLDNGRIYRHRRDAGIVIDRLQVGNAFIIMVDVKELMVVQQLVMDCLGPASENRFAFCPADHRGHGVKQVQKGGGILLLLRLPRPGTAGQQQTKTQQSAEKTFHY